MSKYVTIVEMAIEIAEKLGHPLYQEDYYNDIYYGYEYNFDGLKIRYLNASQNEKNISTKSNGIYISIDNEDLLSYNFKTNKICYIDGQWAELIQVIYKKMPAILNERKIVEEELIKKKRELQELEQYLKYYITVSNKKPEIYNYINSKLSSNNIEIEKVTRHYYTTNNIQCYQETHSYDVFVLYKNFHKVLEFNASLYDIFPNIDEAALEYKPGKWSKIFKDVINNANEYNKQLTLKKLNK